MSYIEVHPEPAAGAARATAATSDDWSSWASRSVTALDTAKGGARESVVTSAFESFSGDLAPRLRSIATLAERQGNQLGQAVDVAVDTDLSGSQQQRTQLSAAEHQTGVITRPVNVR